MLVNLRVKGYVSHFFYKDTPVSNTGFPFLFYVGTNTTCVYVLKELVHALTVCKLSHGCTWEVQRALKKLELLSAAPSVTLTLLSYPPDLPRAPTTQYTHTKHEPIV